ncbi:MAG: hypothetical protein IJC64_00185 [Clostridia bacterium]|nr:hypothetical protein [Clostridia bacterium]
MSKENKNGAAVKPSALKRIRQRNMLKRQRVAIVFMVIAVLALVAALIAVDHLVDIYTFEDVDGTVYYAKKADGAYALLTATATCATRTRMANTILPLAQWLP